MAHAPVTALGLHPVNLCHFGDCRESMRAMLAEGTRVQMCVTSPPYFGLRDYGVAGQIGLKASLDQFIESMVYVFRLVRSLLSEDGTLWLNLGDSYAGRGGQWPQSGKLMKGRARQRENICLSGREGGQGIKAKDLMGVPWRVAFALQADGWYLRQDIIWHKPNPMPESVTDRCTKAHEYLFLLSKSERYYFDAAAIAEPRVSVGGDAGVAGWAAGDVPHNAIAHNRDKGDAKTFRGGSYVNGNKFHNSHASEGSSQGNRAAETDARNRRSVWTVATQPYSEAHFATFPTALIEPCILAGSRPGDIVLDPFFGSGTTGQVSQALGRQWIGCELNPEYEALQKRRTAQQGLVL